MLRAAATHRVDGLLGRPAARNRLTSISAEGLASLRTAHRQTLAANMMRQQALRRVASACNEAGVRVAPLKGMWLVLRLYRDPGARAMVDLDVLVPARDFWRACAALRGAGFVASDPVPLDRFPIRFFYDHRFVHPDLPHSWVELHRYLVYRAFAAPDYDAVFAEAEPFEEDGTSLLALSPEDTLLHLAVHQAKHSFRVFLRDTADVAALAAHGLDWPELHRRARSAGAMGSLWVALLSSVRSLNAPIPKEAIAALEPGDGRRALLEEMIDLDGGTGLRREKDAQRALEAAIDAPARMRWWKLTQSVVRVGDRVRARVTKALRG